MAKRPPDPDPAPGGDCSAKELQILFGQRFRDARRAAGLTQAEVAERTGLAQEYLSRIEHGTKNLTLSTMTTLAFLVGKDVADMLRPPRPASRRK